MLAVLALSAAVPVQTGAQAQEPVHEHEPAAEAQSEQAGHDISAMAREGSGTSWLPDESPIYALHGMKGPWMLMIHENAFAQFLRESGPRGEDQFGSINWIMGMAQRDLGPGRVGLRGMFSLEPWSIGGCAYPDLLATGEECQGEKIRDRQHPHDLFMELAAFYDAPLWGNLRWAVYAGPAGEPALGPVAFPHRISALPNPLAPITHHWFDSTHITFGVVTGGIYGRSWKAEASAFNGREPDEDRIGLDLAPLDSFSGRLWFLPTSRWALQVSAGSLNDVEPGEDGGPRVDVDRVTASATYHRAFRENSIVATTLGWGRNVESGRASNALLVEASISFAQRDTVYGRLEIAEKSAHDLVVPEPPESFTVAKLQGGYTRYLPAWNGFQPGLGAGASVGLVPATLRNAYGSRANAGFAVYLTLRPAAVVPTTAASPPPNHLQHVKPGS